MRYREFALQQRACYQVMFNDIAPDISPVVDEHANAVCD
jgi:hypothetical protein